MIPSQILQLTWHYAVLHHVDIPMICKIDCLLYPGVDHDVEGDEDEERQDLEEDV